jgi:hypothetical protein
LWYIPVFVAKYTLHLITGILEKVVRSIFILSYLVKYIIPENAAAGDMIII